MQEKDLVPVLMSSSENPQMVWVRRDFRDHPVPPPCDGQGHLALEQAASWVYILLSGQSRVEFATSGK